MDAKDLIIYLMQPTAQVALIVGIVEVIKKAGMDKRALPFLDLLFGLAIGITLYGYVQGYGIVNGVLVGLALGLSACGLFSGIKNVIQYEPEETYTMEEVEDILDLKDEDD